MDFTADSTSAKTHRLLRDGRPQGDRQRELLMGLVSANPGVHILRASQVLGLNWNTCLHHVRRLEAEGRVTTRKVSGRLCLFDRKAGASSGRIAPMLLRDGRNSEIARLITGTPGMNQRALADSLGLAASVIHRRLVRLEEAGLVQRVARARDVAVFATDALASACTAPFVPAPTEAAPAQVVAGEAPAPWVAWQSQAEGSADGTVA